MSLPCDVVVNMFASGTEVSFKKTGSIQGLWCKNFILDMRSKRTTG